MGSDYSHRFHAGNHGDVFKHAVLLAVIEALPRPMCYVETHAGEGRYRLGPTGEWTEGIGRLDAAGDLPALEAFRRALARAGAAKRTPNRGGDYPGSPLLALGALGPGDTAVLYERDAAAAQALTRATAHDARVRVHAADAWGAALPEAGLVHIDPPYTDKDEWSQAAAAVSRLHKAGAAVMLWYPIKSLTRPNALLAELRQRGTSGAAVELHVTPQEIKRNALHGSGVVLCGAPPGVVQQAAALAAALGPVFATHEGRWSTRVVGW